MGPGLTLLLVALIVFVLPGVVIVAVPATIVRATLGWIVFLIGLLAIDSWTSTVEPYDDDGVFPDPAPLVLAAWAVVLTIAVLIRREAFLSGSGNGGDRYQARSWSIPLAALASVAAMHWLRNWLAGAEPAELVHLIVIASLLVVLLLAGWWIVRRTARLAIPARIAAVFAATGLVLISSNIVMGFRMWDEARRFADGRPYCVMTYGGFESRRVAQDGWDLSPLVDRQYGVWAISKTPFMAVQEQDAIRSFRYFHDRWIDVSRSDDPHCLPMPIRKEPDRDEIIVVG